MSQPLPNTVTLQIPPEKILCMTMPTDPYLGIASPLTHQLEMEIPSWRVSMPETLELVVTLKLPWKIKEAFKHISAAYMSKFPNSIFPMNNTQLADNNAFSITSMVWNVQGAGSREFVTTLHK